MIDEAETPTLPPRRRGRPRGGTIAIVALSVALLAVGGILAYFLLELDAATSRIDKQDRELDERDRLIDKKETFGASMEQLMGTVGQFDGVLIGSAVDYDSIEVLASRAWSHRWDASALDRDIAATEEAAAELHDVLAAATSEAGANATGSTYEAVLDLLGGGYVTTVIDDADALCEDDVLACVMSDVPQTVHVDAKDLAEPYMTPWLQTGVAYHELAHVLQLTNPEPTEAALEAFGGDDETMADCYALTYLDGWTLDHRVWINRFEYWDVNIGYGHTCDETQRQAVRTWVAELGVDIHSVSQ